MSKGWEGKRMKVILTEKDLAEREKSIDILAKNIGYERQKAQQDLFGEPPTQSKEIESMMKSSRKRLMDK
ncbi:MAG: hypothetical protein UW30_C0029G0003 [Candidatus Giovannonibacteria bacterium GW2011_GWA2_44_13b]|uniref:Uncharacterized protein n=1 Tax=Candidatus Giovannonibacteria bacterium GW2011_GWA2_44_13b TaxID=1618647 RepID=A0A0G1J6K5_9BACT|nr:MAG: hypothetical protein UW30_C0029G0003 [Candidatus Giovannonibacteria bacterium GW2011_GWA2_44_13b]